MKFKGYILAESAGLSKFYRQAANNRVMNFRQPLALAEARTVAATVTTILLMR
jgi:hypothetical protein